MALDLEKQRRAGGSAADYDDERARRAGLQVGRERGLLALRDGAVTPVDDLRLPANVSPAFAEALRQGYREVVSGQPLPLEI